MSTTATVPPVTTDATIPLVAIPLDRIQEAPWNPRKHFAPVALAELAESIRQKGVIEPIIVRPLAEPDRFEIVAGARRHRAARLAHLGSIPAVVRSLDDIEALELAVIENNQRHDITPLEEAAGFQALMETGRYATARVLAAKIGKPEGFVFRRLKLLTLEPDLQAALGEGRLSIGHAEKLLRLSPTLREQATDPDTGCVWRRSPLLDEDDEAGPTADDLRPLSELEAFIRARAHFDPNAREAQMYQPELAAALEELQGPDDVEAHEDATLLALSEDPLVRSRLGAKPGDHIPVPPSRWREVTRTIDRCQFVRKGVVTHGGPARLLDVCATKRCAKHFPPAPKPAARSKAAFASARDEQVNTRAVEQKAQEKAKQDKEAWAALLKVAGPAFAAHVKGIKLTAALVSDTIGSWRVQRIKDTFGVALTDTTAAQVLCLNRVEGFTYNRGEFLRAVKPFKFDLGAVERKAKADQKKASAGRTTRGAKPAGKRKASR